MGDDDKPFACGEPGCGMRFANEDHLSVHRMKHEMSLPLTPGSRPNNLLFVADQTPTPTKFLRNCEEIGLFNELSKNPFEEAFKKAASENPLQESNEAEALPVSDTLNTPSVTVTPVKHPKPPVEPEYIPLPGPDSETGSTLEPTNHDGNEAMDLRVISPTSSCTRQPRLEPVSNAEATPLPSSSTQHMEVTEKVAAPVSTVAVAPPVMQQVVASSVPLTIGVTSVTTSKPAAPQYMMQVLLQLPNGQTVSIPAALATSVSMPTSSPTQEAVVSTITQPLPSGANMVKQEPVTHTVASSAPVSTSSITKQRLKAALTQNTLSAASTSGLRMLAEAGEAQQVLPSSASSSQRYSSSRARSLSLASDPPSVSSQLSPGSMDDDDSNSGYSSDYHMPSSVMSHSEVEMQAADTSTPYGKRARKSPEEDPDERRRKFLERNRAAAARCRQKRKVWINSLEKKADEFQSTNSKLQQEVTALRSEVAQLKSLLLAHKDCPIFLQQRNSGKLNLETVPVEAKSSGAAHAKSTEVTLSLGNKRGVAMATTSSAAMATGTKVINIGGTVSSGSKMVTIVPSTTTQSSAPTIISYVNNSVKKS